MRARPLTPSALRDVLAGWLLDRARVLPAGGRLRVLVDGAPAAGPGLLADALVAPLRAGGRDVVRVRAADFLRPASLRFERGRRDAVAYAEEWLDAGALVREVLRPLGPGGPGRYLPTLWDAIADRATRAAYADAARGAVLLLDGALLLGRGLPHDAAVHVSLDEPALRRLTPEDDAWTIPAFLRYAAEVRPADVADLVVRVDRPNKPALLEP